MILLFYLSGEFKIFSPAHFLPILFLVLLGIVCTLAAGHLSQKGKAILGTAYASIALLGVILRIEHMVGRGLFDYTTELPMHLCRLLAIAAPIVMYTRNRKALGIMYFMIYAGTLNANITPDVDGAFPSSNYFTYWMIHSSLLVIPYYAIKVYGLKITFQDLKNAFWTANAYLVLITSFNWITGSNYFYTIRKPVSASILDFFGPWPMYVGVTYIIGLILIVLLYLPWYFNKSTGNQLA